MTLALFVISVIALAGFACLGIALCKRDAEWMVGAGVFLITAAVSAGIRGGSISEAEEKVRLHKRIELCIKENKATEVIFGQKVCKL